MDENEVMIRNFGDMAKAVDYMSDPWRQECIRLHEQKAKDRIHNTILMIVNNCIWGIIVFALVWFAYMTPETTYQSQDFTEQVQTQSSGTEVVTQGE